METAADNASADNLAAADSSADIPSAIAAADNAAIAALLNEATETVRASAMSAIPNPIDKERARRLRTHLLEVRARQNGVRERGFLRKTAIEFCVSHQYVSQMWRDLARAAKKKAPLDARERAILLFILRYPPPGRGRPPSIPIPRFIQELDAIALPDPANPAAAPYPAIVHAADVSLDGFVRATHRETGHPANPALLTNRDGTVIAVNIPPPPPRPNAAAAPTLPAPENLWNMEGIKRWCRTHLHRAVRKRHLFEIIAASGVLLAERIRHNDQFDPDFQNWHASAKARKIRSREAEIARRERAISRTLPPRRRGPQPRAIREEHAHRTAAIIASLDQDFGVWINSNEARTLRHRAAQLAAAATVANSVVIAPADVSPAAAPVAEQTARPRPDRSDCNQDVPAAAAPAPPANSTSAAPAERTDSAAPTTPVAAPDFFDDFPDSASIPSRMTDAHLRALAKANAETIRKIAATPNLPSPPHPSSDFSMCRARRE